MKGCLRVVKLRSRLKRPACEMNTKEEPADRTGERRCNTCKKRLAVVGHFPPAGLQPCHQSPKRGRAKLVPIPAR